MAMPYASNLKDALRIWNNVNEVQDSRSSTEASSTADTEEGLLPSSKNEIEGKETMKGFRHHTNTYSMVKLFACFLLASMAIAALVFFSMAPSCGRTTRTTPFQNPYANTSTPCGETRDEALARNCKFDLMSFVWTPPECHDAKLLDEFLGLHNWTWYHNIEGTREADKALVHQGVFPHLYVTWEYHKTHCVYMWRKLHRAMFRGELIDGYVGISNHTRHCLKQFDRKGIEPQLVNTHIIQKFPICGV